MFKKIEIWILYLLIIFFLIGLIAFGSIVKYHYNEGGQKFKPIREAAAFISSIPRTITSIRLIKDNGKYKIINLQNVLHYLPRHKDKDKFETFPVKFKKKYGAILILPRYDGDLKRAVTDLIDIDSFQKLHTYMHDIDFMNSLVDTKNIQHKDIKKNNSLLRFQYINPVINKDGSLISFGGYSSPMFKINFCSELVWINDEEGYHHSLNLDEEENIWTNATIYPHSEFVKKRIKDYGVLQEDAVIKISKDGRVLFKKSIIEILSENKIIGETLFKVKDPIHSNDVEPALTKTKFWNKGDLFISSRSLNAIIHYRPNDNRVINFIQGPFYQQHDVDIISPSEISIFNNNESILKNSKYSEVLIYNFEDKSFKKKFQKSLENDKFKTNTEGLSEILSDGSMLVEETNHGRLIFYNKSGEKIWEFVNKNKDGNIYPIDWIRIIENTETVKSIKKLIKDNKCVN